MKKLICCTVLLLCLFGLCGTSFSGDDQCCGYHSQGNSFLCYSHSKGTGNCTWWCEYKRPDIKGICTGNAGDWIVQAKNGGLPTGEAPIAGSIAVFLVENSLYGHVAYVEEVYSDGRFKVTEMGYNAWDCARVGTYTKNSYGGLIGFIYPLNRMSYDFPNHSSEGFTCGSDTEPAQGNDLNTWQVHITGDNPGVEGPEFPFWLTAKNTTLNFRAKVIGNNSSSTGCIYLRDETGSWNNPIEFGPVGTNHDYCEYTVDLSKVYRPDLTFNKFSVELTEGENGSDEYWCFDWAKIILKSDTFSLNFNADAPDIDDFGIGYISSIGNCGDEPCILSDDYIPFNIQAVAIGDDWFELKWETLPDAQGCALRWFGAYAATPGGTTINRDGAVVASLPYSDTEYVVEVKAENAFGSSPWSAPITVRTLPQGRGGEPTFGNTFWLSADDWEKAFSYAAKSGIVANAGFEAGMALWKTRNFARGAAISVDNSTFSEGSKSLKIVSDCSSENINSIAIWQEIKPDEDTYYRLSFHATGDNPKSSFTISVGILEDPINFTIRSFGSKKVYPSDEFTSYTCDLYVPKGDGNIWTKVIIIQTGTYCGTLHIDNFKLEPVPDIVPKEGEWNSWGCGSGNSRQSGYLGPQTNNLLWKASIGEGDMSSSPVISADGAIYFGNSRDYTFYALNPDGGKKWSYRANYGINTTAAIDESRNSIYVSGGDGILYCFDTGYGRLKWTCLIGRASDSSPKIGADGTIYVGSYDYNLYAINPSGAIKWTFPMGEEVISSPAIGENGIIYISNKLGKICALNPNGTLKWKCELTGPAYVYSSPAVSQDGAVIITAWGSGKGIYKINAESGNLIWKYQADDSIFASAAISFDGTICAGVGKKIVAINANGSFNWAYVTDGYVTSAAIGKDGAIYAGSWDNYVYALNPDGSLKWRYNTGNRARSSPSISADGILYAGNDSGAMFAFKDGGF